MNGFGQELSGKRTAKSFGYRSQPGSSIDDPQQALASRILAETPYPGLLSFGNLNLNERPSVRNPDGSISTVRSVSFSTSKGEVLVPTAVGNRILSNREALERYRQTGEHLGIFDTPAHATAYSLALHQQQAAQYGPEGRRYTVPGLGYETVPPSNPNVGRKK